MDHHLNQFVHLLSESINKDDMVLLSIKNKKDKSQLINKIKVRLIHLKKGPHLTFVYSYDTKDITKNLLPSDALSHIKDLLKNDFYQADLQSKSQILYFSSRHKSSIRIKETKAEKAPERNHDLKKKRLIQIKNNIYLRELGIVSSEGHIIGSRRSKFRQIDKYVEILDKLIETTSLSETISIADMGSGKAYLSFALYDHLSTNKGLNVRMCGIEQRENLVLQSNHLAEKCGFKSLKFQKGSIKDFDADNTDILIALHACNTATDDAIYKGISINSKIIICSPCCHKQLRKALLPTNDIREITKFGIMKERLSELLTDSIRTLFLEAYGYKTKVMEFVSFEHTPKNLLLVGIKQAYENLPDPEILNKIKNLKNIFGIKDHYLETLLSPNHKD